MIVVDTNTWADYFNGARTTWTDRLESAVEHREVLAVLPIIVTEVLQGFRYVHGFEYARRFLVELPILHPTLETHINAARLLRLLREKGVTVQGTVDCVIAQTCIEKGAELLSSDSDFRHIARFTTLSLWTAEK